MKATETVPCVYCPKPVRKGSYAQQVPADAIRGNTGVAGPLARLAHPACAAEKGPRWMRAKWGRTA